MSTRRDFLRGGLNAAVLGLLAKRGLAAPFSGLFNIPTGSVSLRESDPVREIPFSPESVVVEGFPFARWWTGDDFTESHILFPTARNFFEGEPPSPTETVDIVVIGGGISGLSTAYMLAKHRPVVFDLHTQFGGNSAGEKWGDTAYSLGGAYVITPDEGSFLESFYLDLGLDKVARTQMGSDTYVINDRILNSFAAGSALTAGDLLAFNRYADVVRYYADESYPEIPLPEGKDNAWIVDLDRLTLKQDIEQRMGMKVPPLLAAVIQSYCYSAFGAGWQELSAAMGWNFLAAEEFGRWVFPGGNSYICRELWRRIAEWEKTAPPGRDPYYLRGGCMVVDVRLTSDKVQVTYVDPQKRLHSMLAKRVVMCCPKFISRYMLSDLERLDPAKSAAMQRLQYRSYFVANVLLTAPVDLDFYDMFPLDAEHFPMTPEDVEANSQVIDILNGHYARQKKVPQSVLTLYWPLPWETARFRLIARDAWENYAKSLAPQIDSTLRLLGLNRSHVRQVRMSRWGHPMPVALPNLIADGTIDHLRRPFEGRIFFVQQDNWALPAVENCLLDAQIMVPQLVEGL